MHNRLCPFWMKLDDIIILITNSYPVNFVIVGKAFLPWKGEILGWKNLRFEPQVVARMRDSEARYCFANAPTLISITGVIL